MTTEERTVSLLELISLQLSQAGMKQEELKDDRLNRLKHRIQNRQQSLGLLRETRLGAPTEFVFVSHNGYQAQFYGSETEDSHMKAIWRRNDVLDAIHEATNQSKIAKFYLQLDKSGNQIEKVTVHFLEPEPGEAKR